MDADAAVLGRAVGEGLGAEGGGEAAVARVIEARVHVGVRDAEAVVAGGADAGERSLESVLRYDAATDVWEARVFFSSRFFPA